jgi:hypothetical protein
MMNAALIATTGPPHGAPYSLPSTITPLIPSSGLWDLRRPTNLKLVTMILHAALAVAFCALLVATLACSVPASAFNRLHEGMTYNEVAAVMGCDGAPKAHMSDAAPGHAVQHGHNRRV